MNYTLHQLRIFLAIAHTGSITKAAELMHLTQPAVSIQLKNLQEQFDVPLTELVGRRVYITEFGRELARSSERIISEVDAVNDRLQALRGQLSGHLRISSVSTGKYVMPYFLTDFLEANKGVKLHLDVTNKSKVVEHLEENSVDFALVSVMPEKLNVEQIPLIRNSLYLVGREQPERELLPEEMNELSMILREQGSGTRYVTEQFMKENNVRLSRRMELTTNEAVKQAVMAGLGFSVMPLIGIGPELRQGRLHITPVQGLPLSSEWNVIWLRGKSLTPVMAGYIDFLKSHREQLMQKHFSWYENFS